MQDARNEENGSTGPDEVEMRGWGGELQKTGTLSRILFISAPHAVTQYSGRMSILQCQQH